MTLVDAQQVVYDYEIDTHATVDQVLANIEELGRDIQEALKRKEQAPSSSTSAE